MLNKADCDLSNIVINLFTKNFHNSLKEYLEFECVQKEIIGYKLGCGPTYSIVIKDKSKGKYYKVIFTYKFEKSHWYHDSVIVNEKMEVVPDERKVIYYRTEKEILDDVLSLSNDNKVIEIEAEKEEFKSISERNRKIYDILKQYGFTMTISSATKTHKFFNNSKDLLVTLDTTSDILIGYSKNGTYWDNRFNLEGEHITLNSVCDKLSKLC